MNVKKKDAATFLYTFSKGAHILQSIAVDVVTNT